MRFRPARGLVFDETTRGALRGAGALAACAALAVSLAAVLEPRTALAVACASVAGALAMLLAHARHRIRHLEANTAAAIEHIGIDPLSGLNNRLAFQRILVQLVAKASSESPGALVAIDIDRFKGVNDTHGHHAGDRLIVEVARRLQRVIREGDVLARLGGDEFALAMFGVEDAARCARIVQRCQDALRAPFDLGAAQIFVTASMGIALCPQDGETEETLSQAADLALYRAKNEGRNRVAFFDKTMERELHLGQTIADDLRLAISEGGLFLLYQPLISACGTQMTGLEALVRWRHPQLGLIPPETFIPLAEARGLIGPLGEWVARQAFRDARRWPSLRMAVNVSPVQFRQRDFVKTIAGIIAASGVEPSRIDLELTEGVLIQDAEQAEAIIMDLRALGIRMGLDDFGSGYSSMIYLRRFAFDKIKIDRAFLESMEASGEGAIILESIVTLGHALGLTVTAEGVEQKEQVEFLQRLGCDEMQGYYFAPPMTADEVDQRLSLEAWGGRISEPRPQARDRSAA